MSNERKNKIPTWRIVVFIISLVFIVVMWTIKDVGRVHSTTPTEQLVPLIVTTVAVSIFKVLLIVGVVFLIKWIIAKVKNK